MPGHVRAVPSRRRPNQVLSRAPDTPQAHAAVPTVGAGVVSAAEGPSHTRWPSAPHIPHYLVLPSVDSEDQEGPIPVVGAHRFKIPPTPVLGASLGLMGLPAVATACRPFRTVAQRYHCARFAPGGAARPGVSLRTGRFPKV